MITVCSRIVAPYDGSELSKKALDKAIRLAEQDARIVLNVLTVVSIPSRVEYYEVVREAYYNMANEMRQEVEEKISLLSNHKKSAIVLEGQPAQMIVEFAKERNADLIIMGSRGLSGLKELFLGSVSHHVVQKATCPVIVVK
ncbi:phosphate starvation protein [Ammoniphilus oxalaticus]|uniref:Phosphate starvation protein n=1 Tax=Ammoniphilus oxalaticus TaxID=66863 RepID=A0A419SQI6_9BACL|nr:universal stress protein [Ammoniphilus oxalaticus]RKD26746.1 phosphate starvation protein [Ammoniphilus oxalaticus]